MIELIEDFPRNVVGIRVTGRVNKEECRDVLVPAVARSLRWRESIRLYYELGSRFPGSGWDDLELGFENASRCERIAIVTDIAWVRLTVKAIRFLIPGEIRVFDTTEAHEARTWITARAGVKVDAEPTVEVTRLQRPRTARPRLAAARRLERTPAALQASQGD
jgi:SpoIIAA-like